jgi:methionyl-tRNA formyltransferase
MRVLIIGRTEILFKAAEMLTEHYTICGIITAPASPEYAKDENDFKNLAEKLGCPFLLAKSLGAEARELIAAAKPDIAVSVNWVSVIREDVIDMIPMGILNAHPGDLPRYRGNAATNWAIVLHDTHITLTVHFMVPGELDSGDILMQRSLPLTESTTIKETVDFWLENTPDMFLEAVDGLSDGSLKPLPQSRTGKEPFRAYPRLSVDSKIDWNKSARDIDALIRASTHPYSGAYSFLKTGDVLKKVYFWKSRVVADMTVDIGSPGHIIQNDKATGESWIYTGQGILGVQTAQYDGEEEFEPGKTWKSIRMRLGIDVESELIKLYNLISQQNAF